MNTTYEQRSVLVQLISLVLVLGGYLAMAGLMMTGEAPPPLIAYLPLFAGAVALLVIVLVAGHLAALFFGMPENHDERGRLINWRSNSNASYVLAGGVLIGIAGMMFGVGDVWVAHFLLLSLLLQEILKAAMQLFYYARGV
ncbi:MAG: hypothetical protein ACI9GW_000294 [Halieaceae bacterium]|jgi:hypothetical protein